MPTQTSTDSAAILGDAVARLRRTGGIPVAFAGQASAPGDRVILSQLSGTATDRLRGLAIREGCGLGGRVMLSGRPQFVNDYLTDPVISHEFDGPVAAEGLRAIAAAPVRVGSTVRALIYGGVRDSQPFGQRGLDALMAVAHEAGVELAVRAEVRRRLEELETRAIVDEAPARRSRELEQAREAYSELRLLAHETADPAQRERIQAIADRLAMRPDGAARMPVLSPRERDVVSLAAVGDGNAAIADRLGLRMETVKGYLRSAARKLGTHSRMATVAAARKDGSIP